MKTLSGFLLALFVGACSDEPAGEVLGSDAEPIGGFPPSSIRMDRLHRDSEGVISLGVWSSPDRLFLYGDRRGRVYRRNESDGMWELLDVGGICQSMECNVSAIELVNGDAPILFVRKTGTVFRSEDLGDTWSDLELNGTRLMVLRGHAAHEAWIYAGTVDGLMLSRDRGHTWVNVLDEVVYDIATSTLAPHQVVAVGLDAAFLSQDSGDSWSKEFVIQEGTDILFLSRALIVDDQHILLGVYLSHPESSAPGVYRSRDGGSTWEPSGLDGLGVLALEFDSEGTRRIYAGVGGKAFKKGLFYSVDGGQSWESVQRDEDSWDLVLDPVDGSTLYEATPFGINRYVLE